MDARVKEVPIDTSRLIERIARKDGDAHDHACDNDCGCGKKLAVRTPEQRAADGRVHRTLTINILRFNPQTRRARRTCSRSSWKKPTA